MCIRSLALVGTLALALASPSWLQGQAADDVVDAPRLFNAHCARCHAVGGTGGEGPALQGRQFRTVATPEDLAGVIVGGLGAMPGSRWLADFEVQALSDYVWSLARVPGESPAGDPVAGRTVFEARDRCLRCHIVSGVGVGLGPELTDIGARRGLDYLRQSVLAPGVDLPRGHMTPHSTFLVASVTTKEGERIRGLRVREDAFHLQIRDRDGRYHSLRKADLAAIELEPSASLMPEYSSRLSETEVEDLVAYLASLRGR